MCPKTQVTKRSGGRSAEELRAVTLQLDPFGYADASVLLAVGDTKVLVSVTLQNMIPHFIRGTKKGWLTAEYAMLPTATQTRTIRESMAAKRNGRSVEISRLLGRSMRAIANLSVLGERTIHIDCDVLQADGSTRAASITAACMALHIAARRWVDRGVVKTYMLTDLVAAVSVGIVQERILLDVNYAEDSMLDADYNFVLARSGKMVEIQGSAEGKTVSWEQVNDAQIFAQSGVKKLFELYDRIIEPALADHHVKIVPKPAKAPLFSLGNR